MNDSAWKWAEHTTVPLFSYKMVMVASVNQLYCTYSLFNNYVSNMYYTSAKVGKICLNLILMIEMYCYYKGFQNNL